MLSKSSAIKLIKIIIMLIIFFVSGTPAMIADENIVVIANSSVPVDSLSRNGLKEIFLGMEKVWKNEQIITIVIQENSSVHKVFTRKLIHKSKGQYHKYWRRQVFLGHSSLPVSFRNENDLIEYIARTPGAIGYVSTAPHKSQIKTILIED